MRELARRAQLSHAHVSFVLNSQREVTFDFCAAIARAFDLPAIEVFRKAELLPPRSTTAEAVAEIVSQLEDANQAIILHIARALSQYQGHRETPRLRVVAEDESEYAVGRRRQTEENTEQDSSSSRKE